MSDVPVPVLLPRPRRASFGAERVVPTDPIDVRAGRGGGLPAEGYRLVIGADGGIRIDAADDAGEFYARATLAQLGRDGGGAVPVGEIEDWPDVAVRGVMLDVSRDKVPTMATVRDLIDRLASWKINHVQLYMEHTFAYADHEVVWRDASPFTAAEIQELDAFCRERHVELAPNQNCLGHMERWLRHDRYRGLAIRPEGTERFGRMGPPTTLDPAAPGSFELVAGLLGELLPAFSSRRVHVGLDEPWELPRERYGEYVAWMRRLRDLDALDGHEMLVWGDILAADPSLVDRLPDGVTVCEWGYEDWHPFAERAEWLRRGAAGAPWLCPGTSSWLSITGRWTNARGSILHAAEAAVDHGAAGVLNTDWGDLGHLQYLPISEPGFAYGAAVSWCVEANRDLDVAEALDVHAFGDEAGEIGGALVTLGDLHRRLTPQVPNFSSLVMPLYFPLIHVGRGPLAGADAGEYDAVLADLADVRAGLGRSRLGRHDGALVIDELDNAMAIIELACADAQARLAGDGSLEAVPATVRAGLAERVGPIVERHRELWAARNRPGGLDDSVRRLDELAGAYRSGDTAGIGGW